MPVFRYRTRDLTRVISGVCPCGRTHRRIDRIRDAVLVAPKIKFVESGSLPQTEGKAVRVKDLSEK